jgi:phytanoyl-CoA hydroxylase
MEVCFNRTLTRRHVVDATTTKINVKGLAERFQERGFVLTEKLIDDAALDVLREEIMRVIADKDKSDVVQPVSLANLCPEPDREVWQIVNIWQASPAFETLLHNPVIAEIAAACIGAKTLRIWHDQVQYKPAAHGGVNFWHQDAPYWGSITPKDQQITAWIALDDADVGNGCMSMVPGSHKWGVAIDALHAAPDYCALPATHDGHEVAVVRCPVPAGAVHLHHSLTWHGSHANTSGRPRRAVALHFMTEKTVRDEKGAHLMDQFIDVKPGEPVQGDVFPQLWPV